MSSRTKSAGQIKVYRPEYIKELTQDVPEKKVVSNDDSCISYQSLLANHTNSNLQKNLSSNFLHNWLSEKSITCIQEKTDYESRNITNMYQSLLENEKALQKDLDDILTNDLIAKSRKVHWLLQNWYEKTYIPLDNKICEQMNSISFKKLDKEKRKQFLKYLKHLNKKGHTFLDIFEEEEYDPLSQNKHRPGPIKAVTEKLADPLLHQQHKRNEEDRVSIACELGVRLSDKEIERRRLPPKPLVPLGRHDTQCSTWLNMKLHDIQSDVRFRSQERLHCMRNISTICLHDVTKEGKIQLEMFVRQDKWKTRKQFPGKNKTTLVLI